MLPDLNRLRVFAQVYALESVSLAAKELHVTQSAVSQTLAKLEDELGVPLFIRRHRRLIPTPAAASLAGIVAPFIDALRGGVAEIHRAQHELSGVLRVGAPAEFGAHRLPAMLAEFRREHPAIRFELTLAHSFALLERLDESLLDLAFTDVFEAGSSRSTSGLEIVEVLQERLILVAESGYEAELLGGGRGFRRLATASFVAYDPRAPAIRGWFRHHFDKQPPRLDVALSVESVQAVIAAIRAGMGLGVVPAHTVATDLKSGDLTTISTRRRAITNRIALARLLDKVPSRAERAFVRFLREMS